MDDKQFNKYFGHIEEHKFNHYNRALGCKVESKEHFKYLLDKGGYVPSELGNQMAEKAREMNTKKYDGLSDKSMKFLHQVKDMADSKGNIEPGSRFIKGLEEHGVRVELPDWCPTHYKQNGGFTDGKK